MNEVCIVRRIMDAWELNDQHQYDVQCNNYTEKF